MTPEKLCAHCVPFRVPDLPTEHQSEVAACVRAAGPVRAMCFLTSLGLPIFGAKAVAMHVTREPGRCERCAAALDGATTTSCRQCSALNLDW